MPPRPVPFPRSTPIRRAASIPAALVVLLVVACSGGGSTAPADAPDPPRIATLDPLEGPVGTEVAILGEGFGTDPGAIEVTFGGVAADLSGLAETSLRVMVPDLEVGEASVVVTVADRTSAPGVFRVVERPSVRPPVDAMTGRWTRTLVRAAADGTCPDPLPEREVVELRIEDAELVLGEASGDVSFDGTWRATGSVVFDDGSSIRLTIEARFVIENGRLAIVGELLREHRAPDGATTCTETYDLRLDPA